MKRWDELPKKMKYNTYMNEECENVARVGNLRNKGGEEAEMCSYMIKEAS